MTIEFREFMKKAKIPLWLFKVLPRRMKEDLEYNYYELKEREEKEVC